MSTFTNELGFSSSEGKRRPRKPRPKTINFEAVRNSDATPAPVKVLMEWVLGDLTAEEAASKTAGVLDWLPSAAKPLPRIPKKRGRKRKYDPERVSLEKAPF